MKKKPKLKKKNKTFTRNIKIYDQEVTNVPYKKEDQLHKYHKCSYQTLKRNGWASILIRVVSCLSKTLESPTPQDLSKDIQQVHPFCLIRWPVIPFWGEPNREKSWFVFSLPRRTGNPVFIQSNTHVEEVLNRIIYPMRVSFRFTLLVQRWGVVSKVVTDGGFESHRNWGSDNQITNRGSTMVLLYGLTRKETS